MNKISFPKINLSGPRKNGQVHAAEASDSPESEALIDLRQVVKVYQTAAGGFTALKGVDLRIERGEFVAITGRSGSGKSTLINMIAGIDRPTSGEVRVAGTAVHTLSENQLARWRGRSLGIVFQFFQLLPTLSAIENVMLPMDFCATYPFGERRQRALAALDLVDLADHAAKLPAALSGGQQQRVAIARALANDPPLIIADEPTGNLDSKTADAVFELFETLTAGGKTVVMVTHDSHLAERAGSTVVIHDGEVVDPSLPVAIPAAIAHRTHNLALSGSSPRLAEGRA
jgi:putative ABC transport system ATP-binding protein